MNDGPTNFIISLHVDLLNSLGVDAFKVASTDNQNIPLLEYISKKNKPVREAGTLSRHLSRYWNW